MAILDLATYKLYKKINSTTDDAKNTLIIDAVNTFIEVYTGRVFTTYYNSDKIEYYSANDTELFPVEHPIQSITALEYSTDNGATYTNALVEFTDYITDTKNESVISLKGAFCAPAFPTNAIRLTYQGGYASVPDDLELCAVHLTDFYRDEDYQPRKSLAGASIDNVIQPDMTARLPSHMRRVLENYRNIVI